MPKNQWPGAAVGADFMSVRSPERANVVRGALQQEEKKPLHANKKDKKPHPQPLSDGRGE